MNPILIKRFFKYNKSLVAVISVSLIVVLFMLVIVIFKYLEMVQANAEVTQMRNEINDLQDARKNKVAVRRSTSPAHSARIGKNSTIISMLIPMKI